MKAIVTSRWHLIEHQTMGKQLYDWINDPGELNNLIDTPEGQSVSKDLEAQMNSTHTP